MKNLPMLGLGWVRHARLKPARHAFMYRGLFLRLPMRAARSTGFVPLGLMGRLFAHNRAALVSFHDRDHGLGDGASLAWLEGLLAESGITDADGEIWLHTFPRIFGYGFKPVSFWYCERADGSLRAVLAEVNNTFGERHCYLLANADGSAIRPGQLLHAAKVFHVSPFNPVQGSYRFRFLARQDRSLARVDYHDAEGCVLETSISGEHRALSTGTLSAALARSGWFTAAVIARIHWHALKLWLKRVPFYTKPTPPSDLVSR
ncbi:hypothetical protein IP84_04385 [beta proteobacterium AAP99]|nr:hypothetical protein IP84_04385 [beta proteobacterium AAP99]